MKLIKNKMAYSLLLSVLAGLLLVSCQTGKNNKQTSRQVYYTCSMHPQVHKDKPGDCPVCGMKLIKVDQSDKKDTMSLDTALSYLTHPVTQTVIGSFKVITPVPSNIEDTINAEGAIDFDQRDFNTVSTRVGGRIDGLFVKYSGQSIERGEPLMEIYSPELLSAQRDLLQTIRENDQALIGPLKEKLLNLGMAQNEIQKVTERGKPLSSITIFSPYSGISRQVNDISTYNAAPELLNIRKGMYVDAGQSVFAVQDISRRWATIQVFSDDIPYVHVGDPVGLYADADPDRVVKGRVDFIPPYRDQGDKTTAIRIYLKNLPATWKIGTLLHGKISVNSTKDNLFVPLSAVNRLGSRTVVWVKDKHRSDVFYARPVQTGIQRDNTIEILSGIGRGDQIVENAAYMVDSDSFIQ